MVAAVTGLALVLLGVLSPVAASGSDRPGRVVRIGDLTPIAQPAREDVFRQELRRLGPVEGQSLAIGYRSAEGRLDRLPGLAAEPVRLRVDLIVAVVTQAALAARQATKFELMIDARTARALGISVPPSLVLRADHIVQ